MSARLGGVTSKAIAPGMPNEPVAKTLAMDMSASHRAGPIIR
jgi:hypothetical protein